MILRRILAMAAAVVSLAAVAVAVAPAQAAPARLISVSDRTDCPKGYACLWRRVPAAHTYIGVGFYGSEPDFSRLPAPYNIIQDYSDRACNNGYTGSLENVIFYTESNYRGRNKFLRPGQCSDLHTDDGRDISDTFSSVRWVN